MTTAFTLAAGQLLVTTTISLFALVDGLQFERYFGRELEMREDIVLPLFDTYPDSRIAFAGPWLIDMHKAMAFRQKVVELEQHLPAVSWLLSASTLSELLAHLQQCINVEMPDGRVALLRLQDPRVQVRLGEQLDEGQHWVITREIAEWYSSVSDRVYSLKRKEFIC
ncbi:DUF4123 domain-containing protein [Pseudescherichia sp.]|uniref:DUF4123 domain-containing protein n=1 Tax=Pseudescherichia sp. TaxID=2055881 RepID=UPI002897964E|nr:DUF4123 domain-containing protein [Pseudescherichia sp.]